MNTKSTFKKAVSLITLSTFLVSNLAFAAPEGSSVVQGSAAISQSGNTTTINQTSQAAVINWNSFNTASHEGVQFNQPNSSAVALNRITNGLPTQFAGSLTANGHVWILNPAGVLFTNTATVDVAGLVATTHGITDANFMAGNYKFDLVPGSENSKIINNGLISAKDSGIVALVAPGVENNGTIIANLGKVHLASGSSFVLDMYGDQLINFGSHAPIQNGSVSNSGLIKADGGKVYMTARTAAGVLDNVISMSGTIEANAVSVNQKGEIVLHGGSDGTTVVSGKLHAKGGGHIETSGAHLIIEPTTEIDAGVGGSWLMDPTDITVDSTLATIINGQLNAGTNVTLNTASGGSDQGNITVISPITATMASATLSFIADNDITINSPISVRSTFSANAAQTTASGKIFIGADITSLGAQTYSDAVVINANSILTGSAFSFASTINDSSSYGHSLKINSSSYPTFSGLIGTSTPLQLLHIVIPSTNTPQIAPVVNALLNLGSDVTIEATTSIDGFVAHSPLTQSTTPARVATLTLLANNGSLNLSNTPISTTNGNVVMTATTFALHGNNFGGGFIGGNLTINAPSIPLVASNSTGGTQTYNGGVSCNGANCFFTSTNGSLTFNGTLSAGGGADWIFSAANGILTFAGSVVGGLNTISTTAQAIVFNPNNLSNMSFTACCGMTFSAPVTIGTNNAGTMSFTGPVNFNSTVDGPGNLTLNSSTLFRGNVGGITSLASLVANGPIQLNNSSLAGFVVKTVAAQNFTNSVTVTSNAAFTSTTGSITFAGGLTGGVNTFDALGGSVNFNSAVNVASLSVLNAAPTTINTAAITATTLQSYSGPVTLSAANISLNTSASGTITFGNTVNGGSNLTLNTTSGGTVNFNNIIGGTTALTSLTIPNSPAININAGTTSIRTVDSQTYSGPILFNSLAAINFIHTNLTAPRAITFNNTVNRTGTSTAITITGNLALAPTASIGLSSQIASLLVTGTTLGPNITTVGDQTYTGAVTLNTDEIFTSTGGNILFSSTINGDGVLGRNLTVNAISGIVSFSGNVGFSAPLSSLNVNATTINNNGISITSTGAQNYTGSLRILNGSIGAFNTTLGGDITFNGVIGNSENATVFSSNRLVTNSSGQVIFNANVGIGVFALWGVDLTATNGIVFNAPTVTTTNFQTYNSPVILKTAVSFQTYSPSPVQFLSTVDSCAPGPGCLTPGSFSSSFNGINVSGISPSIITLSGAIGSINPLSSFTLNNLNGPVTFNGTFDVAGPVSITAFGFYVNSSSLPSTVTFNGAIGSLTPPTTFNVTSTNNLAPYNTSVVINSSLVATGAVTLTAGSGTTRTVTLGGAVGTLANPLASLTVNGLSAINLNSGVSSPIYVTGAQVYNGNVFINNNPALQFNGTSVTFNGSVDSPTLASNVIIQNNLILAVGGSIGQTNALNSLLVNGTSSIGGNITTVNNQTYTGATTLTATDILTSNSGNILFSNTINGAFGLTVNALSGSTTFANTVGATTALTSLTASGTVNINGGSVRTSTFQNYQNAVVLGATTTLSSIGGGVLSFASIDSDGTSRALTLTTSALTTLGNNVGISSALDALTVTNSVAIGGNIHTVNNQLYGGAATLIANPATPSLTTLTSDSGNITFNSTINGGFNLATTANNGNVTFNGVVGGLTPLSSLTSTSTGFETSFNTTSVNTTGAQTYHGWVSVYNTSNPTNFNFSGSTISFDDALSPILVSPTNPVNITITGNFVLDGPNGNLLTGSCLGSSCLLVNSLHVTGTSTFNLSTGVSTMSSQSYDGLVTLNGDMGFSVHNAGGSITFGTTFPSVSALQSNGGPWYARIWLLTPTSVVNFNGIVGGVGGSNPLSSLDIINSGDPSATININTTQINTTGLQNYHGIVRLGTDTTLTSTTAGMTFSSTVDSDTPVVANARALTLVSPLAVTLSGNIGSINKLKSLTIGSGLVATPANIATSSIATTTAQTYYGPVLFQSLPAITFSHTNLTSPNAITFNNTVNSATTSTAITITGNLAVGPSGSIGLQFASPGNVHVDSLLVSGTTLGPNVTTAGPQNYVGALTLNTNETMTSTGSSITYGSTVDGDGVLDRNLTAIAATTVTFTGAVGNIVPLGALVVTGTTGININGATVNTVNYQTYNNLVTMGSNLAILAGSSGCSTTNCVQFTLGTIGTDGITGPGFDLAIFTYDASKGAAGDGIAGTVNVANFTMGGTGGGNVSPNAPEFSTVGGSSGVGAWNNTVLDPLATGMYCVNGFCISGTRVLTIDASDETKGYGQIITPNPVADVAKITVSGLAPGDSILTIDLASAGYPQTATVAGSTYTITASNASGAGLNNHYTSIVYNNTPGQLTVESAPLIVTADDVIKTYGQTTTFTGTEFLVFGTLYNGDNITSVTLVSPGAAPTAGVLGSPYIISASGAVGSGLSNYSIMYYSNGTITVNPAALTITSLPQTKVEGTTLPPTTTFFTPVGLQNGETIGTVDIASLGLDGSAPIGNYPITNVTNATGGTFDVNNYVVSYVADGNIIVSAPIPLISPPLNVPPTEEFDRPVSPNCGIAGCDNLTLVIYPIGIPPELLYSSEESNVLGVVTDTAGDQSHAINSMGQTRVLKVGSAIYKDDQLRVASTGCVCLKTTLGEKKCISTTRNYDETRHTCKIKNEPTAAPQHTLTTVLAAMKSNVGAMLAAPVAVEKPDIKKSDEGKRTVTWEHFPLTTHDMYMR